MARFPGLGRLRRSDRHEKAGFLLYGAAVTAARDPFLYRALGIPDTLDGRFDAISLYVFLLIHRLRQLPDAGPGLAQAVFDAMFGDMDINLREMGVGDLSVGRRVRAMWEAFHGRSSAYAAAVDADDIAGLELALARNVWRGAMPPPGAAAALARLALAQAGGLAAQPLAALAAGKVRFMPASAAAG